jgi:hypothetical protein
MDEQDPLFHAQMALFHSAMATGPFCKSEKKLMQIAGQVASLMDDGGPEVIEGVKFDFRHPLVDPSEWGLNVFNDMIMCIPGLGYYCFTTDAPSFWFPWFGKYNSENYSKRVAAYHNSDFQRELRSTDESGMADKYTRLELDEIIKANRPKYFVEAGDTIRIHTVTNRMLGDNVENGTLEHDHDAIFKEVTLELLRKTGCSETIGHPFKLVGHRALLSTDSEYTDYTIGILWRMVSYFKLNAIGQLSGVTGDNSIFSRAAATGIELYNTLDPLSKIQYDETDESESAKFIVNVANQAAMLGFMWAKAEAEINLKPLAKSALKVKENSQAGGKNSGEARRKMAQDGWQAIARQMAIEIRTDHPGASQDKVAEDIRLDWRPKKPACPQHPTLKKFISDLERSGQLAKRKVQTREAGKTPKSEGVAA